MNNTINYFYNIESTNINQIDDNYQFTMNNNLYILKEYNNNDINKIYNLNQQMIYNNIPVHQIILNKYNNIISNINNKNYILLKIIIKNFKKRITLEDINKLNSIYINPINNNKNWANNWIERIDYIEYQINQTGKKYPNIVESLSYFIGLSENAISYYKNSSNNEPIQYSYSHKKLTLNSTLFDLYDPCNITIDYKSKDISEYIKISFYNNNKNIIKELHNYFKTNYLSFYSIKILYARLLYPTIYFQTYDDIITNKQNQKKILSITSNTDDYEKYLYKIYLYLKKYYPLPEITWLKKS